MKYVPLAAFGQSSAGTLPDNFRELRRFVRRNIKSTGRIRVGRRRYSVRLENLSEQGCQIWLPLRSGLLTGTSLTLHIESVGPFEATVRWHRDGWAGIEFDMPVYPPRAGAYSRQL